MDPVTQGVLGAVAAQAVLGPRAGHRVWIGGLAGGLLPDADLVLEPLADPALPWELHRHFTHAYVMAPVMGLLAGGLLLLLGYRRRRGTVLLAAVLGALTHAPLDLCTSFGTKVYWPFSLENAALDLFPIIDPVFTVVLIACVLLAAFRHARAPALVAVAFLALYVGTALSQRGAALDAQATLAASRGHAPARARVMAAPASLLAWRSIYEFEGRIYSDLIRPVPFGGTRVLEGTSVALLGEAEILDGVGDLERVRSVVRRFSTFADGWTARVAGDADTVGDMRFSLTPGFDPPWALRLGRGASSPAVRWEQRPFSSEAAAALLRVILGTAPALRPLQAPR